jgi:hypothetical protein
VSIFAAFLVSVFCGISPAAWAVDAEAVIFNDTTFTVLTPPVRLDRPARAARASVVLISNGFITLGLDSTGALISGQTGDFLIRSANLFLRHGLNVMITAEAFPNPGGFPSTADVQGLINAAGNRWGKPVWMVGNGVGGLTAVAVGGAQPALAGLRGVVMTATATNEGPLIQTFLNVTVPRIIVPALVVWHRDDLCVTSPPAGSAAIFAALTSIGKASAVFEGGHSVADNPCDFFSAHGFAGIEEEVVETIAEFIRRKTDID